ncbi:MAG: glucosamine-6-phosphate deaminase [Candidatus Fimadaptatus sp.]|jgi:glucosamine-6-phosphate deaminase
MAIIKEMQADSLKVIVADSREAMGQEAARRAGECIRALLAEKDEINMIFAAAPSQNETLKYLMQEQGIDWSRVNAFHMDEYVGLSREAPQSFGRYLYEHVFSHLPFKCVHYLRGDAPDAEAECARYSALLRDNPVDVVMLGIGENAHIAFNDPWVADFSDPALVKRVPLDPVCRQQQVNDGCFASLELVPEYAFSLTIPALTNAGHMFCTVPAATKRNAVTLTVTGKVGADVPATAMRSHADATMFCDPDSAAGLLA